MRPPGAGMHQTVDALTLVHHPALRALVCRAMHHAARTFGELTGTAIITGEPEFRIGLATHVPMPMEGSDVVVGARVEIDGAFVGRAFLLLRPADARCILDVMLGDGSEFVDLPSLDDSSRGQPFGASVLTEVANITLSAFCNEIGNFIKQPVNPGVPTPLLDRAERLARDVVAGLRPGADQFLVVLTTFKSAWQEIQGTLMVVPDHRSLGPILTALGIDR